MQTGPYVGQSSSNGVLRSKKKVLNSIIDNRVLQFFIFPLFYLFFSSIFWFFGPWEDDRPAMCTVMYAKRFDIRCSNTITQPIQQLLLFWILTALTYDSSTFYAYVYVHAQRALKANVVAAPCELKHTSSDDTVSIGLSLAGLTSMEKEINKFGVLKSRWDQFQYCLQKNNDEILYHSPLY